MFYALAQQQYRYEHGVTAAEQRAADVRVGEAAAAVRDLRLRAGRVLRLASVPRPQRQVRPVRAATGAIVAGA
jgi:hypothetical protein